MPAKLITEALASLARGDLDQAQALAREAVARAPDRADGWRTLGLALQTAERHLEAFEAYEQALRRSPDDVGVAAALARSATRLGMHDAALALALHVAQSSPGDVTATVGVCDALLALDRAGDAAAVVSAALEAAPAETGLIHAAGRISRALGRLDDAIALFQAALEQDPGNARILYDLAWTLADAGRLPEALAACDAGLASAPDPETAAATRFLQATVLLALGDLQKGWRAYSTRLDPALPSAPVFDLALPRWDGGTPLDRQSLLVMAEQGLGDEIAFLGMTDDVLQALGGGQLTICCDRRLTSLVARSWPTARVLAHETQDLNGRRVRRAAGEAQSALWTPMGDLLPMFRSTLGAFEATQAYLRPDPARVEHWRAWLASLGAQRTVGVTWRSRKMLEGRSRNFASLADWAPVLSTPGVAFVSLQYGDTSADRAEILSQTGAVVHTPPGLDLFNDLEGLAALASALDLVLGFSNASTNLAGAVGAPLWLLTPPAPWTALGAEAYPWYPQARRFTAQGYADWDPVMQQAAEALRNA